MKRQKIMIDVRQGMMESAHLSTSRDDEVDYVQAKHGLSSEALRARCLGGIKSDYWNR
ncbi:hypothetical protein ES708_11265 [subsurface metagenome]